AAAAAKQPAVAAAAPAVADARGQILPTAVRPVSAPSPLPPAPARPEATRPARHQETIRWAHPTASGRRCRRLGRSADSRRRVAPRGAALWFCCRARQGGSCQHRSPFVRLLPRPMLDVEPWTFDVRRTHSDADGNACLTARTAAAWRTASRGPTL